MQELAALLIGYLLGCLLPAYFIARARGVDLRSVGDRNLGTANVFRQMGRGPAVLTALYDMAKGPLAIVIAFYWLGAPEFWAYSAGLAAIVGHRYPFYLGFKGGRGFATASGLLFFGIGIAAYNGWLQGLEALVFLAMFVGMWAVFRGRGVPDAFITPIVYGVVAFRSGNPAFNVFFGIVASYIWVFNVIKVRREHLLRVGPETRAALRQFRVLARPGALAFPILYLFIGKTPLLILIGSVLAFFMLVDVSRLLWKRFNVAVFRRLAFFYRPNEERAFTSATLFLAGAFLAVFLFPKPIATMALVFVTFGDLVAKYAGLEHGRTHVMDKTLEGSLMCFLACAGAGFVWSQFVPMPPAQYLLGALAATLAELLPFSLNDNFTVPLVSSTVMLLPAYFGVPGFVG